MTSQQQGGEPVKVPRPSEATFAYRDAATQMQLAMGIRYTNDADKDFVMLLAAGGSGAVALARIELAHGKDPEIRRLAEALIAAEEKQAALLRAWQAKHP